MTKFRAWNNYHKYMDDDFYVYAADSGCYDKPNVTYDTPNIEIEHSGDLILMQSTGIFDKDGIEIYEGDIVEQWVNNHYWRYVIQKLEGLGNNLWACCFEDNCSVDEDANRYTFQKQKVELGTVRSYVTKQMKVIGNIYQDRELLGEME